MSTHHMLDIAPIPEKVLYINEPWLIDVSFDGMEKVSEEPDPNPDNVRVYLPLDLNAEAILRRLRYVIYRYGEANEANESNYGADVCVTGGRFSCHTSVTREPSPCHTSRGRTIALKHYDLGAHAVQNSD